MKKREIIKGLPCLLLAAALVSGCGSNATPQAGISDTPNNSTPTIVKAAETGSVTIAVKFPTFGKSSTPGKAIIDERTSYISLSVYSDGGYGWSNYYELYPDPTTGIATTTIEMPVGISSFNATAYDGNGYELEHTQSAGKIVRGVNSVVLTFATGDWQFVAADGTATSINLTNSADQSVPLVGFGLKPSWAFNNNGYVAKAAIDPALPRGGSEYGIGFYTTNAQAIGPIMYAEATHQFSAQTSSNSFESDALNLDAPERSDTINNNGQTILPGDRIAMIIGQNKENNGDVIKDTNTGEDLTPIVNSIADSRFIDGKTMAGHLIELTFNSESSTVTDSAYDCQSLWTNTGYGAAARSAALSKAYASASRVSKASPGDVTPIVAALTVEYDECEGNSYQIDGDGDNDFYSDYLYNDVNMNGLYDPADGDLYSDYNSDGNYDYIIYNEMIDGDGDGDFYQDRLAFDKNGNGRHDAADGDSWYDDNGDGNFDYTYYPGTLSHHIEQFSDVKAIEFRAKAQQVNTLYTDFGLPPTVNVIIE